jgi:hypothetical protein
VLVPLPFALHASTGCPPAAELALSLAGAFHDVDARVVDDHLDAIAVGLSVPRRGDPATELAAVADLAATGSLVPRALEQEDTAGLMLDRALETGRAHPLTRALILAEAACRRGIPLAVVSNGADHCVAHTRLEEPIVLLAASDDIVDAHTLPPALSWRCAHEVCGLMFDELEERWLRWSRIDLALQASQLRLHLPFDEASTERARARLEHVRAHFN